MRTQKYAKDSLEFIKQVGKFDKSSFHSILIPALIWPALKRFMETFDMAYFRLNLI